MQRAALRYGGIVKVAELRDIHDIAEHAPPLRFCEDLLVQFGRGRGRNHEKHPVEIVRGPRTSEPFEFFGLGPGLHLRRRVRSDDADGGVGFQKASNFGFGDLTRADDEAAPTGELEEHGEEDRGRRLHEVHSSGVGSKGKN